MEIEPNDAWALSNRGETYRMMNRYEESLADLNKSLEIESDNAWTLGSRGSTYRMMNRYEDSLADLTKALEIEPNNAFALESYEKIGEYENRVNLRNYYYYTDWR